MHKLIWIQRKGVVAEIIATMETLLLEGYAATLTLVGKDKGDLALMYRTPEGIDYPIQPMPLPVEYGTPDGVSTEREREGWVEL